MALYHIRLRKDSPLIFSVIGVNLLAEQLILTDMFVLVLIYIFIYPHLSLIHHANSCLTVMQKRKEMAGSPINFCFNKTSKLLSKPSTFAVG